MTIVNDESVLADPLVISWINEFTKVSTKKTFSYGLRYFCTASNRSPSSLVSLSDKDLKQLIIDFQNDQKSAGANLNSVVIASGAVRNFLGSQGRKLEFRRSQLLKSRADNSSHIFTNGDLARLWNVGDACDKAVIATACSLGWEVSMFIDLERAHVAALIDHAEQNDEQFIFFMDAREKTMGVPRLGVLNPLAITCIRNYLAVRKDTDPRLFPFTPEGIQKLLNRLAKDSNLKLTGNIRFHNIRKWLMSRLSRCNFNVFQIKFIMGKSIGISDQVYLQTLKEEVEEKYPRLYNEYLNICFKPSDAYKDVFSKDDIEVLKMVLKAVKEGKVKFEP